jgi:hypothetical protein
MRVLGEGGVPRGRRSRYGVPRIISEVEPEMEVLEGQTRQFSHTSLVFQGILRPVGPFLIDRLHDERQCMIYERIGDEWSRWGVLIGLRDEVQFEAPFPFTQVELCLVCTLHSTYATPLGALK